MLLDEKLELRSQLQTFLHLHQPQLQSSSVPEIFWQTLYTKLRNETFDAGEVFQIALFEDPEDSSKPAVRKLVVSSEEGIDASDDQHIYLVDHAWTYEANRARQYLEEMPQLLTRMCDLMGFQGQDDLNETNKDERVEFVLEKMWKYNNTFSFNVGEVEDRLPLWYIMDEVGCAISHSDEPNFRSVPFIYLPEGTVFSLIFPIKNLEYLEEVTRDYVENLTKDPEMRRALLLPWVPSDFDEVSFDLPEPDVSYFLSGRNKESYPENEKGPSESLSCKEKIKVYTEYDLVGDLCDPFEITQDKTEADILWLMSHFTEFKELVEEAPGVHINQFPFENVLTVKDLLSVTCRRQAGDRQHDPETLETFPSWYPTTFNLTTELVQFVSYFKKRESLGLDNHWICKPWNLARGMDMHITRNLSHILRLPCSGPKIVQKYIERPLLFQRPEIGAVKFDLRYVILLQSAKPLKAFAYANFFIRFANKEFVLNNFDDYERHFTVMNYNEETQLCHMKCAEFVERWNTQYPSLDWEEVVQPKILAALSELLQAAVASPPPKGIAQCSQSRSMYAVDLMLHWRNDAVQPLVLEVNFIPDCKRACDYYPSFFNDLFKCLFLDKRQPGLFHVL